MASNKSQKRNFNGMSYHEIQRVNSENRSKLSKESQKWLKNNGYKNVGWVNVVDLHKKIQELIGLEDLTLEELFLEADRVGNKYLTKQEIEDFSQTLSREISEVENEIEKSFPDTEFEVIDYFPKGKKKSRNKNQKRYGTTKV